MQKRPSVFIHIGAPKTGTTYLQAILFKNREALRGDGVLYPGDAIRSHFWASLDLRDASFMAHVDPNVPGAWRRLVAEARAWPRTSVIDHETFAEARQAHIDQALADLDFADVHVIWTARDIVRQLPAAWQESIKNRETASFAEYLEAVRAGLTGEQPRRVFWPVQAAPRILARWSRRLPPERVHVVTVPPSGADPTLLWRRFAAVLGIDPTAYDTDVVLENSSFTAAEAAVLRELNALLADIEIPWPAYRATIKHGLTTTLGKRSGDRIALPEAAYEWALEWSHHAVALLRKADYDIVGDLDELIPSARPAGDDPDTAPAEERALAATRMLAALVELIGTQPSVIVNQLSDGSPRRVRQAVRRVARGALVARALRG